MSLKKTATIKLPVADDGTAEGPETAVFTLQDGPTYQVAPNAIEGKFTIVDTADQAPPATVVGEPNDTIATAFDTKLSDLYPTFKIKSRIDFDSANPSVDATEDVDFYKFTLKAGETVTIDTDATAVNLGNFINTGFNTVLRLFDANGNELALNNNGSAPDEVFFRTLDSFISYTAETDGTYYVAVSSSNNNAYDPNQAGTGSGSTRGEYELEIKLNPEQPAPTALPPARTPAANAPTVTMDTVVGTFDGVRGARDLPNPPSPDFVNPNFDNIVVPALVQSLAPTLARGQSLLTFSFQTEGEIPPEGVEVFIKADADIAEFLNKDARVLLVGANTNGPIYSNTGELIGFKLSLFEPQANATFVLQNKKEAETDGPKTVNFSLLPTRNYKIGGKATLPVTVYDTIEQANAAVLKEPFPEVSLSLSQTALVESEGTETTLTFNVKGEIPAEGLLVYVDSPTRIALSELDLTNAKITGGQFPPANFDASGFYFKITEQTASITFKALDETKLPLIYTPEEASEGLEGFTYKLVKAPGYTVNTEASEIKFTIADTPDSQVRVSLTGSPAVLVEAEGTVAKLNFSLSAPPPEEGVLVTIAAPEMLEFNSKTLKAEGGKLVSAAPDNTSFTFRITSQTASVSVAVADDGVVEQLEKATFTLLPGVGYEVSPTASVATFTLVDTTADIPPITQETDTGTAGNDTLKTANVVSLRYGEASVSGSISGRSGVGVSLACAFLVFVMVGTSAPLPPALAQIVQRFQRVSDPKQRYEQLISLAKRLDPLPEAAKIPENKVSGCVSQVYITADLVDGKVKYQGDSDSQLVKGLVALLIKGLDGLPPEEILQVTPDFIQATGLNVSLTPSRANGFYNIFRMMQQKAYQLQGAAS
ncbi:DVUA0089 family protein [Leptolyngbya sp. 7M]|uniref:DVUA0089 family protein n=1 Tax=Leptolyngbya sp. 7M TaxID=2812896 RepID=UPI001B8B3DDA|nr:DVUA0089 family protein [Leptolyngbya sp. 7M]QYO62739.1 DVUA0089 family protein [Leptolyngbya sp. 7M]